ncbi:MAG: hypothetical protein AAGF24_13270 [Cyanobacteria bacterium P01_H01_bin.121]
MNASAQALSIQAISKVANIPILVRAEFPELAVDFSPWLTDQATQVHVDPNSIDFGFLFKRWHPGLSCSCFLLRVLLSQELTQSNCRLQGIEATGHRHRDQHWHFSSLENWQFEGERLPSESGQQQLKQVFMQIQTLFHDPASLLH